MVFANNPFLIEGVDVGEPLGASDHKGVSCSIAWVEDVRADAAIKHRDFLNADYANMNLYLAQVNWDDAFEHCGNINHVWTVFTDVLDSAIDLFVPWRKVSNNRCRNRDSLPRDIKGDILKSRSLWLKFKRNRRVCYRNEHRRLNNVIDAKLRKLKRKREERILNSNNNKLFFNFIKSKLSKRSSIPSLVCPDGAHATDSASKANALNAFFSTVFTADNGVFPHCPRFAPPDTSISNIEFDIVDILQALKSLKVDSATGPDGIPSRLLKNVAQVIAVPLKRIFRFSFLTGTLPDSWLSANVTPVFKKGSPTLPDNYRPISLTSVVSKVMERVIRSKLTCYLFDNNLISQHQHGFLAKRSTLTQLLECTNEWSLAVACRKSVDVVYLDLAKAFDSVSHTKLLHKLRKFGLAGCLMSWLSAFLSDRKQRVCVEGQFSNWTPVLSGVPQGTILGPLLFVLYINDITQTVTTSTLKLYADDSKLFRTISCKSDCAELQHDLNNVHMWATSWQLTLSMPKCCVLHIGTSNIQHTYCILNHDLENVLSQVDLGVTITSNLKPTAHCAVIVSRAYQRSGLIYRAFESRARTFLVKMFCTYVRPILESNSPVWAPYLLGTIDSIEKVQRSFTKRIPGLRNMSYSDRLSALSLEPLEVRRIRADILELFKIVRGVNCLKFEDFFEYKTHNYGLRGHNLQLELRNTISSVRRGSFAFRVVDIWNTLPPEIVSLTTVTSFKRKLSLFDLKPWVQGRSLRVPH